MEEFSHSRKEFLWLFEMCVVTGVGDDDVPRLRQARGRLTADVTVFLIQLAGDDHRRYVKVNDVRPERRLPANTESTESRRQCTRIMCEARLPEPSQLLRLTMQGFKQRSIVPLLYEHRYSVAFNLCSTQIISHCPVPPLGVILYPWVRALKYQRLYAAWECDRSV